MLSVEHTSSQLFLLEVANCIPSFLDGIGRYTLVRFTHRGYLGIRRFPRKCNKCGTILIIDKD